MNKFLSIFTTACIIVGLFVSTALSENRKIAQTGMKLLIISSDARLSAMSSAVTSLDDGAATSLFYNPSSMANADWNMHIFLDTT